MLKTLGVQLRASMPVPSKGEVLLPERIRATTGGVAFLPHPFRFSGTSVNNPSIVGSASHCNRSSPLHKGAKGDSALPTLPNPHYPTLSTTFLPPLSKGGGLTARHKLLLCCILLATRPPFYSLNFSAVKTEGLLYAHQPLHPHNLLKSTSIASPRTIPSPITPHFPIIHCPTFISSLYTLDNFRR